MSTIVCLRGGHLAGRYDLTRSDVPPEVHHIGRGDRGDELAGYLIRDVGRLGSRTVVHAMAVDLVEIAAEAERREQGRERGPWRVFTGARP